MNNQLINKIEVIVEKACRSPKNHNGYTAWTHHIKPAVGFGVILARKLKADQEIVALSLLLHDYGSVFCGAEMQDEHHITGSKLAEELLLKYDYPKERVEHIKQCIFSHRASQNIIRDSIEANIVASADALSHFAFVDDLLFYAYVIKGYKTDEGRDFVLNKLQNSFNKLIPEAKKLIDKKFKTIKIALKSGI